MRRGKAGGETLVLCYHAVSDSWPADLAVTPLQLRRQLEWLVRRGYRGVTFSEAVAAVPAGRTLVVTFDDAYLSVLELAYPILFALGLPATVFAVTDYVDANRPLDWLGIDHWRGGPHERELRGMTWDQLGRLAAVGWEIGSHTCTHPRLTRLDDDALAIELRESRASCERALGRPCDSLAYPFGDFDARVAAAAGRAGYAAAAIEDLAPPAPLTWPRVGIYRGNSMRRFRLKVSPALRRLRSASPRRVAVHA
ncbi:MAG TPA: polysaccharide deacetylase family protein [Gaiellaceae bacterium]|jgi:peptidoglycan/xylan/chitin deacetylase (PgdA/CDA1 family)